MSDRFRALQAKGEKALVCYIMAGDPSLEKTVEITLALDEAGVDAIELGVPFSDPLADGPSIQAAAQRALDAGASVAATLEALRRIRQHSQIPIVLMTYFNPTLRYGVDRFARDSALAGADGVIQTDLTPEEAGEWMKCAKAEGLDTVYLLAPTSTQDRIDLVTTISSGFVYCVSRTGVTGARDDIPEELKAFVRRVKDKSTVPVFVGFGISKPEHVGKIGAFSDGVVVGSALVEIIAKHGQSPGLKSAVKEFAASLKAATLPNASN